MWRLHLATGNKAKIREFNEILTPLGITLATPQQPFGVDEDGETFTANALKKAAALMAQTQAPTVADDSGLEVRQLGGAPGVRSARYAGTAGPHQDFANRHKLLQALADVPPAARQARFVCAIVYCAPQQASQVFVAYLEGHIAEREAGTLGFGYDSLFIPQGSKQTLAELLPEDKNAISHRGQALQALAAYLQTIPCRNA